MGPESEVLDFEKLVEIVKLSDRQKKRVKEEGKLSAMTFAESLSDLVVLGLDYVLSDDCDLVLG